MLSTRAAKHCILWNRSSFDKLLSDDLLEFSKAQFRTT